MIESLNLNQTALLLFDYLNGHVKHEDGTLKDRYKTVLPNAVELLKASRSQGLMIAYAMANHREDNLTSSILITDTDNRLNPIKTQMKRLKPVVIGGTWGAQIVDELCPEERDYLIPKYRWNAFYQTYLDLALRNRNINTIILAGGSTDVGIASTAFSARDMDYNLVIVRDACTSPEKDNHDQFMNSIFPRMARVRSTEQVIRMLLS